MTTEEKLDYLKLQNEQLHQRLAIVEHFLQSKFNLEPHPLEKQHNMSRTEAGQGPILTSDTEFL